MAAGGGGATAGATGAHHRTLDRRLDGDESRRAPPQKIASLTLIEPVLVFASMSVEAIVRSIPASIPWLPKKMRDDFNSWTAGGAPVEDEPVAQMIEAGMMTYRLKLPIPAMIDETRIAALDMPTLVILAERSPMHDSQAAA